MALSPQLLQFKSSGVYRLEFDKSTTANINVDTLRLVVGHSRRGPYNTPVLVSNIEEFSNVFGSIDRTLEKKGMFFHRSVAEALSRGPVLALNVASFTATDKAYWTKPSSNGSTDAAVLAGGHREYTKFFNNDKFMVPSDERTIEAIKSEGVDGSNAINFVNIKQTPITVFARKAQNTAGFEITARDWYGEGNVPEFMNDLDLVSDFMVDVFVFKGDFTNAASDPVYGAYFDGNGYLLKDKLSEFANLREVTLEAQYTGSLIPGFRDLEGRNLYIESMINTESRRTGLFCAIDEEAVTKSTGTEIDLVGHDVTAGEKYELLSYDVATEDGATGRVRLHTFGTDDAGNLSYTAGTAFTVSVAAADVASYEFPFSVGDFVPAQSGRLAMVKTISKIIDEDSGDATFTINCSEAPNYTSAYMLSFEKVVDSYKPFIMPGSTLNAQTITSCLSALNGTGLANGLVDKDLIDFRYIVDTFASYDTMLQNKSQLAELAKLRQNASAILNAPTVADFKKSDDPVFTNDNGEFKVQYIATGGNLDKNPSSTYALPGIPAGANYAFYYGPGLVVTANGKDIIVPPAAYVSNNYIDKYTSATPWSIIAGPRRGVVNGNGVKGAEYAFDKADRDILEPFGINPIVFQRGVGLTILGNKTAQQSVKSALSSAHVREALIYIQDGIADILKGYVFEFNNAQTRLEIKTLADSFMEGVKADGGVYEFKNVMDQSNNTDDVIDQNFGIIDTYVEPVKGLEIVVHRTTILNTGEIQTGNFN